VIVGGLAAIAAGALVASSPEDRYIDFAVEKGAPAGQADEVRASLANLFVVSGQEADLGIGLYLAVGGGALAVIGGLTAVFGRRKPKPIEEAKEPSEAGTGGFARRMVGGPSSRGCRPTCPQEGATGARGCHRSRSGRPCRNLLLSRMPPGPQRYSSSRARLKARRKDRRSSRGS
jgi:hypothetical protein